MGGFFPMDALAGDAAGFPVEWAKAALIVAMICTAVVIALFGYVNYFTRRTYFRLWTVAWMFYLVYLGASFALLESPQVLLLRMVQRSCMGISALLMYWGAFRLGGHPRRQRELILGLVFIVLWSWCAMEFMDGRLWSSIPVCALLSGGSFYTAYFHLSDRHSSFGKKVLGLGFVAWGLHLLWLPVLEYSPAWTAVAYLALGAVFILIVVGMIAEYQHELSEHVYQTTFESSSDAILIVELETGRILEANAAAGEFTGEAGAESVVGRDCCEMFPELADLFHVPRALVPAVLGGQRKELHLCRADGKRLVYEAAFTLMQQSRRKVLLFTARDVTEQRQSQVALQRSKQQLELALTELRATQHQIIKQERLHALEKMARGVAHDFNNVLAKLLGFCDLLVELPADSLQSKQHLKMMRETAQTGVNAVNRLREFYRTRKPDETYDLVDLGKVIGQAAELTRPNWQNQSQADGVTISLINQVKDGLCVRGLFADLQEVFMNLIMNSVEAMPRGGTITIGAQQLPQQMQVTVQDTGVGMDLETQQRCLEPFYTTKPGGSTGLGLAIVHGIVQRHAGNIEIQSVSGQGTTVLMTLPAARSAGDRAEPQSVGPAPTARLHILVVEDEAILRDIEAQYLTVDGHTVEVAADGREALAKYDTAHFDLVLTDKAMPHMNGDALAEQIKKHPQPPPVIMATGYDDAKSPWVDVLLTKPFTQASLRRAIHLALAKPR